MKIEIKNCKNCPFCVDEYDDWSMGDSNLLYCNLARFQNLKSSIIDTYNNNDDTDLNLDPEWCPLKKISLKIEHI